MIVRNFSVNDTRLMEKVELVDALSKVYSNDANVNLDYLLRYILKFMINLEI